MIMKTETITKITAKLFLNMLIIMGESIIFNSVVSFACIEYLHSNIGYLIGAIATLMFAFPQYMYRITKFIDTYNEKLNEDASDLLIHLIDQSLINASVFEEYNNMMKDNKHNGA